MRHDRLRGLRTLAVAALLWARPIHSLAQDGGAEGGQAEGSVAATPTPVPAAPPSDLPAPPVAVPPAPPPPPALFADDFEAPGVHQAKWDVAGGAWNIQNGAAYTRSEAFRAYTRAYAFQDVELTFDLVNLGLTDPTVGWHGVHVFLRRVSEQEHYLISVNRADHTAFVVKKSPGGLKPVNGGTYYELASARYPVPYNQTQKVRVAAVNNPDGTVSVALWIDGALIVKARDRGVGGRTISQPGSLGFRGDYAGFLTDNLAVRRLIIQTPPFGAPLQTADGDMMDLAVPEEAQQPQAAAPYVPPPAQAVASVAAASDAMTAIASPVVAPAAAPALDAKASVGLSSAGDTEGAGVGGVHSPVPRREPVHRRRQKRRR